MSSESQSSVLSDSEYTKAGISLWINNQPRSAILHLEKKKSSLNVCHGYVLLNFVVKSIDFFHLIQIMNYAFFIALKNAVISFETDKIEEVKVLLKDLESRSSRNLGWIRSILKSRLFGYGQERNDKSLIQTLEEQIILADTQLCSAILEGMSQDIAGIMKAGWLLRKAWKVYDTTYRHIYHLYNEALSSMDPLLQGIDYFQETPSI
jgi:hypothetical protein